MKGITKVKNNIYEELEAILENAIISGEDPLEVISKKYAGRKAVNILLGIISILDDWRIYMELLTIYRDFLSKEEIKRLTESAKVLFEPDLFSELDE